MPTVEAEPYVFEFDPRTAVLVIIDMQRDFVDPGWYVKRLRARRSQRVLLHAIVRQNPPKINATVVTIMGNPHLPPSGCFPCTTLRRTKQNTSS